MFVVSEQYALCIVNIKIENKSKITIYTKFDLFYSVIPFFLNGN